MQLARRIDATVKARDAALAQGQVLEAVLADLAPPNMMGPPDDAMAWLTAHREAVQGDESTRLLIANVNPRDKAFAQDFLVEDRLIS